MCFGDVVCLLDDKEERERLIELFSLSRLNLFLLPPPSVDIYYYYYSNVILYLGGKMRNQFGSVN